MLIPALFVDAENPLFPFLTIALKIAMSAYGVAAIAGSPSLINFSLPLGIVYPCRGSSSLMSDSDEP